MKKNRGFVFIETMVTIVILSAALLSLYSLFNALVIREKRRHYYDDPIYIYRANYITNMFIEKYLAAGSNSSTSILNDESYNYALAADLLAIDGEHSSHIRSISCDNDFFDNINNSKSECETFFNDNQIYKMYVASYDLSFLKACSNKKLREGLDLNDTCTEYEYMSSQAKQYIKTLKYIKGANGYYFIYEFNDNGRGGACTSDDCIHQFAAVKRGTVNDVDVYGGASGSIVVKNGTISIPDDEVADNYNIGVFTNLVGNGSFEDQSQTNFSLENLSYTYSNTEQSNGSSSLKITNTSNNSAGYLIFDDDIATNSSSDYYCRYSSKSKTQSSLYFPYSVRKKLANNATGTTWNTISGILTKPEYESSNVAIGLSYDTSSNTTAYIDDLMCLNINEIFDGNNYPPESWFNQLNYFEDSIKVGYQSIPDGGRASFIISPDEYYSLENISITCNEFTDGAVVEGNRIYINNISGHAVCNVDLSLDSDLRTLTIDPNGGSYLDSTSKTVVRGEVGDEVDLSNTLTRPGYIFTGWEYSTPGRVIYYDSNNTSKGTVINTLNYNSENSTLPNAYNNGGGGSVTLSMVNDSNSDGYALKVVTNGTVSPGAGGVYAYNLYPTTPDKINVLVINAKIPIGYRLAQGGVARQYTGIASGQPEMYGDDTGTWEFKTYYIPVYAGHTGVFQTGAYIYLTGTNLTDVTWYIKSISVVSFDRDDLISKFKFEDDNATIKAVWRKSGSKVVFNPNGGTFNSTYVKSWVNDYYIYNGETMRFYTLGSNYSSAPKSTDYNWTPDTRVITKEGYQLDGWYTSASGGTKVFNADGTLVRNVSGYSNGQGEWQKYDSNVTLYAHWAPNVLTVYTYTNGATHKCVSPSGTNNVCSSVEKITDSTNVSVNTSTIAYTDSRIAEGWPADYYYPWTLNLIRYGYKPTGYLSVGSPYSASAITTISTDWVPTGGWPATTLASNLGVLNNFKAGNTSLNIYSGWQTAFIDSAAINSNTGAFQTGSSAANYMATQYYFPVQGGTTLKANYKICGAYVYDGNYNYISRVTNYSDTIPIPSNAKFVRFEINKTNPSGHDYTWWSTNIVIK